MNKQETQKITEKIKISTRVFIINNVAQFYLCNQVHSNVRYFFLSTQNFCSRSLNQTD